MGKMECPTRISQIIGKEKMVCTGFAKQGLFGIANDAIKIAEDIYFNFSKNKRND